MSQPPPTSAAYRDPLLGAVLAERYRVESLLARGGTGAVYRATQILLQRPVAVKIMRPDLEGEERETFEERFLREASLMGALQHPNIVTVHDFGRLDDGTCFIVMELLEGLTLKQKLKDGPMGPEEGLELALQLTRGLRHAHRAGLIHRDIKAGNAMIVGGEDGGFRAKLLDFGLVRGGEESTVTGEGRFLGTPHYTSPEQARGLRADGRSDLYSLGVLLYRVFTGRLPYYDRNPMTIALAHIQQPYPPMRERAPDAPVPAEIEDVIRRCMAKDPADRFPDADALFLALQAARARLFPHAGAETSLSHSASAPAPAAALAPPPSPAEPSAPGRRWPIFAALALLLAVPAVAGVAWWGARQLDPVAPPAAPPLDPASLALAEPEGRTPAPAPREVYLLLSSEPAGALVKRGDEVLGVTPLARKLAADPGPETLQLTLDGYKPASVEVDLSGAEATAHAVLKPVARAAPRPDGPAPRKPAAAAAPAPAGEAVFADGVHFTAPQAAAALRFVNTATEAELRASGIAPNQVKILLERRPFADLPAVAATYGVGEKTLQRVLAAVGG